MDKLLSKLWANKAVVKDGFTIRYDEGYFRWLLEIQGAEIFQGKTPVEILKKAVDYYKKYL